MKAYFILLFATCDGYRQSLRFHTPEPVDFERFDTETKHAFMLRAFDSHGLDFNMVSGVRPIVLQAFATERECKKAYKLVRGDKHGLAPHVSRSN